MPSACRYEVCRRLRADPATCRIPVIFVTACTAELDEERGIDLGAVDYITKPFSIPIVRARVRSHLATKKNRELIEELSLVDPLTGIANRRRFDETLHRECKRAAREGVPLSVLMIDIDHFKAYNDHYGHIAGDQCLMRVAASLRNGISRSGDLVARYGGEEFVVVLPATDREAAETVAERLRSGIEGLAIKQARSAVGPGVTVSVGCATGSLPGNELRPDRLVACADAMLYRSKANGRNRCTAGKPGDEAHSRT